jgi:hypothetical protein
MKLRENSYTFQTVNQNNAAIVLYRLDNLFIDIIHLFTKKQGTPLKDRVYGRRSAIKIPSCLSAVLTDQ